MMHGQDDDHFLLLIDLDKRLATLSGGERVALLVRISSESEELWQDVLNALGERVHAAWLADLAVAFSDYAKQEIGSGSNINETRTILNSLGELLPTRADVFFWRHVEEARRSRPTHRLGLEICGYAETVLPFLDPVLRSTRVPQLMRLVSEQYMDCHTTQRIADRGELRLITAAAMQRCGAIEDAIWILRRYANELIGRPDAPKLWWVLGQVSCDPNFVRRAASFMDEWLARFDCMGQWEDTAHLYALELENFRASLERRGIADATLRWNVPTAVDTPSKAAEAMETCHFIEDSLGSKYNSAIDERLKGLLANVRFYLGCENENDRSTVAGLRDHLWARTLELEFREQQQGVGDPFGIVLRTIFPNPVPPETKEWPGSLDCARRAFESGEFLQHLLEKFEDSDFGLAVFQYAKALEEELHGSVFSPFADHVNNRPDADAVLREAYDCDKTKLLASRIGDYRNGQPLNLTLGEMLRTLSLCRPGGRTLRRVGLLRMLGVFFRTLLEPRDFPTRLTERLTVLRNRSAHAGARLDRQDAIEAVNVVHTLAGMWFSRD